ncbi:helix-turn-helix transcriptional regulator [Fusibacter ferrireducens]|uniref:YafY family transcriptional regulator n=1 Tax=Fusibacter ferrireducens TaxID=2785058 RepID=A0ABR9ZSB4_9FIRM|nr:YafY family protein [Fusibacter ferrireducens]MBF4693018.1 YafY family transcriptional regulator [Fusibacter ferrireducens]
MKSDRQLAIINLLTEYKTLTAPMLAERFEVSRRTINRDIDELCLAGIPIVTTQGKNGGISLMEGYTIDKRILKKEELKDIVAGLKGIESISKEHVHKHLQSRLCDDESDMIIDLASHYKNSLSDKIENLKSAIRAHNLIAFDYYSPKGCEIRQVEPYKIMYKWSGWYLLAYCIEKEAMRVFKLNRLWSIRVLDQTFEPRKISQKDLELGGHLSDHNALEVLFDKSVAYLLVESYGPDCYVETEAGKLHFKGTYTNESYIISWLLSFGNKAKVIKPESLIAKLKENVMQFE